MPETITYKAYPYGADNGAFVSHNGSWKTVDTPGSLITNATTAQTASAGEAMSGNITLHKIAKTGTYSDLIGTPSIPSSVSDLTDIQVSSPQTGQALRYNGLSWQNSMPENDTLVYINTSMSISIQTDSGGHTFVTNWAQKNMTQYILDRGEGASTATDHYYLNLANFFDVNPDKKLTVFIQNADAAITDNIPPVYAWKDDEEETIGTDFNIQLIVLNPPIKDILHFYTLSSFTDMVSIMDSIAHVFTDGLPYLKLEIFKIPGNNIIPTYTVHII